MDIIKFKIGDLEKRGVVIKLLWLVALKICFEKLATMYYCGKMQQQISWDPSTAMTECQVVWSQAGFLSLPTDYGKSHILPTIIDKLKGRQVLICTLQSLHY